VLETQNLTKRFGKRLAVNRVNLSVFREDIFGFLGPNGAGKSTTIRMVTGLVWPDSGKIRINGEDVSLTNPSSRARFSLGALVETPRFYEYLSGKQNLRIIAELAGVRDQSLIDHALTLVGLYKRRNDHVRSYSQGMKQRLGIAQAILGYPDFVILDEPNNGLDPQGIREMRELIRELNLEKGMTFFISSHILSEVEGLCNRVAVLSAGELVAQGHLNDLLNSAHNTYIMKVDPVPKAKALLGVTGGILGVEELAGEPGALLITTDQLKAEDINLICITNNIAVSLLKPSSRTLEDFFLELTGSKQTGEG